MRRSEYSGFSGGLRPVTGLKPASTGLKPASTGLKTASDGLNGAENSDIAAVPLKSTIRVEGGVIADCGFRIADWTAIEGRRPRRSRLWGLGCHVAAGRDDGQRASERAARGARGGQWVTVSRIVPVPGLGGWAVREETRLGTRRDNRN